MDNNHYPSQRSIVHGACWSAPKLLAEALEEWLRIRTAGRGLSPNTRAYRRDIAAVDEQLVAPTVADERRTAAERVTRAADAGRDQSSARGGGDTGPDWADGGAGARHRPPAALLQLPGTGVGGSELCGLHIRDLVLDVEDPYVRVTGKGGAARDCFRHTVAMQLVGRGEPMNVVQAPLGHASLSSTQIYIRAAGHHVREAAHVLPGARTVPGDAPAQPGVGRVMGRRASTAAGSKLV